jgi:hypothetical protein
MMFLLLDPACQSFELDVRSSVDEHALAVNPVMGLTDQSVSP